MGFVSSNKTKLTFDTGEALKDFFVLLKWRYSWFELFCFVPPNYLVVMNYLVELKVCSLQMSAALTVADVALVGWPGVKPDSLSQGWKPSCHCWAFCLSLAGVPLCVAGQAFHSAPEKVTEGAHEACFTLHYQSGSARVRVERGGRMNEKIASATLQVELWRKT